MSVRWRHRVRNVCGALFLLLLFSIAAPLTLVKGTSVYGGDVTFAILWTTTVFSGVIWLVTTDTFIERLPVEWRGFRRRQRELDGDEPADVAVLSSPPEFTPRELAAIAESNREQVFQANVQHVLDELSEARRVMFTGIDDGWYWTQDLSWGVWDNVRDSLRGQKEFGSVYNATRDAYDALIAAETMRLNYDPMHGDPMLDRQARILRETTERVDVAIEKLTDYVEGADS